MPQKTSLNYDDMDDDNLIRLSHNQDKQAQKTLIQRYQFLVYKKSQSYFLPGGDKSDIIQEGLIGLYKAIRDYKVDGNASFKSFACICILRNIISAVKKANRHKRELLNHSISLDKTLYDEDSRSLQDVFQDKNSIDNPVEIIFNKQKYELLESRIKQMTSELEYNVYQEFCKDKSYKEIASALNIHTKSVDNAIQRLRKKIKKFLVSNDLFNGSKARQY